MFKWCTYGKVNFAGDTFNCDIVVDLEGQAHERPVTSLQESGDMHDIGLEDLAEIIQPKTRLFLLGTGQHDVGKITEAGKKFLKSKRIKIEELPTQDAIKYYNDLAEKQRKKTVTLILSQC